TAFGMKWVNALLDEHCLSRWILLADADEILVWPGSATENIRQLTARFDERDAEGLFSLLLDMYSDRSFGKIGYVSGEDFFSCCPFFDRGPYTEVRAGRFPYRQMYGGVRARVFQKLTHERFEPPTVSKVPLLRWQKGQAFNLVAHGLAKDIALAP